MSDTPRPDGPDAPGQRLPWDPPRLRRAGTVGEILQAGGDGKLSTVTARVPVAGPGARRPDPDRD
ncbi:MAG: hypothetical protein R2752_18100 [Vicinamibacterales bacterium]